MNGTTQHDGQHPTDGTACPEIFENYPDCQTCTERGHRRGNHRQCDPWSCPARTSGTYEPFDTEPRYDITVVDQDGRLLHRDYAYILCNATHPNQAAVRIASDMRHCLDKDTGVLWFEVLAVDKSDGREAYTGYRRTWEPQYLGSPTTAGGGLRLFELDYSHFGGTEGYRYFHARRSADRASHEIFDQRRDRRIRRLIVREIPFDPAVITED